MMGFRASRISLPSAVLGLIFGVCCALPIGWLLLQVVSHPRVLLDVNFTRFHGRLLARTVFYNSAVATIATAIALPAAWLIGRGRSTISSILGFLLPLPLLLPSITYAYGWSQVLRLLHYFPQPASIGDVLRCIWTLATWLWPLAAVTIGLSLRQVDVNLQQHAMLDGGYWRITFRQLLGPIVAAWCMVGVLSMQEFAVYEPTGISVVATEVRAVFDTGMMNLSADQLAAVTSGPNGGLDGEFPHWDQARRAAAAVVTAMPLLGLIAVCSLCAWLSVRHHTAVDRIDPAPWPRAFDARWPVVLWTMGLLSLTVVLPTACMVLSLKRSTQAVRIWETFSPQVLGSLFNASLAGGLALVIAMLVSFRSSPRLLVLGLVTFLVGGQLLAIAQIRLYNHRWLSWIYNAPPIVVMAYIARFGWMALMAGQSTWSRGWRDLREMAALDGADGWQTARFVIWPLALPIALAAGVLVMVLSLTEVPATVLLAPQRPPVLVPLLMAWVHTLRSDDMLEASLLLMTTTMVLGAIALALVHFGRRLLRATPAIAPVLVALFFLSGCSRSVKPDEVWLETGASAGQVVYPRGITYSPADDTFFVVDRMARIQHFDHSGKFINGWRLTDFTLGKPVGISVGPDRNLYVPDTHYHRVLVFSPQGKLLRKWGEQGTGPGQFIYPTDVAFDDKGNLFVSEYGDHDRVQVFDPQCHFLYQFGKFGQGDGAFSRPQSMLIDEGLVYITDACNHRICVFKTDGTWVRNMGHLGSAPGEFRFPYGLDQDHHGNLVICEFGNNRVQRIDKATGSPRGTWGSGGREEGQLAYPWGVIVDKKDRVVVVDSGNNRLQVFGF
jgi:ABC-type Fe3+ transport system permease subunit/DNA-binding beta-propeller fold protein YncE